MAKDWVKLKNDAAAIQDLREREVTITHALVKEVDAEYQRIYGNSLDEAQKALRRNEIEIKIKKDIANAGIVLPA